MNGYDVFRFNNILLSLSSYYRLPISFFMLFFVKFFTRERIHDFLSFPLSKKQVFALLFSRFKLFPM